MKISLCSEEIVDRQEKWQPTAAIII